MPRLSDALKRKLEVQTIFELQQEREIDEDLRMQALEIEAEIVARAKREEQAALEDEQRQALLDFLRSLDDEVVDHVQPVKPKKNPPVKRKHKDTLAEKRAKEAAKKRRQRSTQSQGQLEENRAKK